MSDFQKPLTEQETSQHGFHAHNGSAGQTSDFHRPATAADGIPVVREESKWIAFVSYLTLVGWVIALVLNNDAKNKSQLNAFHLRQSLTLMLAAFALSFINIIPILGQIVWLVGSLGLLVLWVLGFIAAVQGRMKAVPLVGEKSQEWFSSIN
ncbi:MAG: hypothetical protein WBA12_08625 [Catalinimonas sp.]